MLKFIKSFFVKAPANAPIPLVEEPVVEAPATVVETKPAKAKISPAAKKAPAVKKPRAPRKPKAE
jgi:hypothetical protein